MFILILKSFTNSCIIAIRYIVSNIYILILQYDFDYLKELEKIKKNKIKMDLYRYNRNIIITFHVFTNYSVHKVLKTADFQTYKHAC